MGYFEGFVVEVIGFNAVTAISGAEKGLVVSGGVIEGAFFCRKIVYGYGCRGCQVVHF